MSVYICLDENNIVVNAVDADDEIEAQEKCSVGGVTFIEHINGMPFLPGWTWDGEKFFDSNV
jgi:hypothetical protein